MDTLRTLSLDIGGCKRCGICAGLGPDYIIWDSSLELPFLKVDQVPETLARELVVYCPEGCITLDDE